ncbi:MAG: hypothetical protein KJ846_01490, partial [Proteobacteria bacterium]|nr:hypothetical protein [Pseudomonadota bacterium]
MRKSFSLINSFTLIIEGQNKNIRLLKNNFQISSSGSAGNVSMATEALRQIKFPYKNMVQLR